MGSRFLAPMAGLLIITGCTSRDPVAELPGHLEPGSVIDVAQQAIGGARDDALTIGARPVIDWDAPNVPVMVDGEVDHLYFWPDESESGLAIRDGHWVRVKVREQSFTQSWRHSAGSLFNVEDPIQRYEQIPASARIQRRPATSRPALPYSDTQTTETEVTVMELDQGTGSTRTLGSARVTSPGGVNGYNPDAVQEVIDRFNQDILDQQRQLTQPPAGEGQP